MTLQFIDALRCLRTEYLVTPDLLLTPGDAAALLHLDRAATFLPLQALEESRFLELTPDGRFGRAGDQHGRVSRAPLTSRRPSASL